MEDSSLYIHRVCSSAAGQIIGISKPLRPITLAQRLRYGAGENPNSE